MVDRQFPRLPDDAARRQWARDWIRFECLHGGVLEEVGGGVTLQGVDIGSVADDIYLPVSTAIRKFDRDPLQAPLDAIADRLSGCRC